MSQANATGATWNYYFAGYRSEEDDAYGTQHVLLYNPRGRPLFEIQDLAGLDLVTSTLYDGIDLPYFITKPEGGSTLYYYWATPWYANNLAQITLIPKPGSSLPWLSTEIYYDATWNKPILIQDPLNLVTTMTYDPGTGSLLSTVADSGSAHFNATTRYTYNAAGQPLTITDPLGVVTQYAYDASGNLTSTVRDPGRGRINAAMSYAYDSAGNVTSSTNPNSRTTVNTWDAGRRLLTTTLPSSAGGTGAGVATALHLRRRQPRSADPAVARRHDPAHDQRHLHGDRQAGHRDRRQWQRHALRL